MIRICFWLLLLACILAPVSSASLDDELKQLANDGRYEELLRRCNEALGDNRETGSAQRLLLRASAQVALGHLKLAAKSLQGLADAPTPELQLSIHQAVGTVLLNRDHKVAQRHLDQAMVLAENLGDKRSAAAIALNQAILLSRAGDREQALAAFAEAAARAGRISAKSLQAMAECNAALCAKRAGLEPRRLKSLAAADEITQSLPPNAATVQLRLAIASQLIEVSRLDRAMTVAQAAETVAKGLGNHRGRSMALGLQGQIHDIQGEHDNAVLKTRQALFAAQQSHASYLLYRWNWQLAQLHRADSEQDKALQLLEAAAQALEPIRHDLAVSLWQRGASYRDTVGPLYFQLADQYLRRGDAQPDYLRQAMRVIERFKSHELEDYYQDECVNIARKRKVSLDRLATGTAVLYVVALADRTELLLGIGDDLHRRKASVGRDELAEVTRRFRQNLEIRTSHRYLREAQTLHEWLLKPLLPLLEQEKVHTLVFVPDGPLRLVPLAALHDGEQFLVNRFATVVVPGLTLLDPKPIAQTPNQVLLNGLSKSVQGFPALPFVDGELNGIGELFETTTLHNESFKADRLSDELQASRFPIVHIASHGEFTGKASESFVLTWDGKLTLDGLEALIRPYRYSGQPVELLTLSACRTAAGDERAALGLAGVAIKAGARSAIASLWYVNDQASSNLITDFYKKLHDAPEQGKAEALRQAQMAIAKQRRYRHPLYWAPFLVIGNWQ